MLACAIHRWQSPWCVTSEEPMSIVHLAKAVRRERQQEIRKIKDNRGATLTNARDIQKHFLQPYEEKSGSTADGSRPKDSEIMDAIDKTIDGDAKYARSMHEILCIFHVHYRVHYISCIHCTRPMNAVHRTEVCMRRYANPLVPPLPLLK